MQMTHTPKKTASSAMYASWPWANKISTKSGTRGSWEVDKVSPVERSRIMRAVRRQDTAPELAVRRLLHAAGYRYRLHDRALPGTPDLVFSRRRKAIFIHGCFWHGHHCRTSLKPKSRQEYWQAKIDRNRVRDQLNVEKLEQQGWGVLCVWECETGKAVQRNLKDRLIAFLGPPAERAAL
jgi:DNA mismatch endonuclease (patch repair protein)